MDPGSSSSRVLAPLKTAEWCTGHDRTPSDNLYCKNLPAEWGNNDMGNHELRRLFATHGTVKECRIFPASTAAQEGACALVRMGSADQAARAVVAVNCWAACTGAGTATHPIFVRYADTPDQKLRKQAKRSRTSQASPHNHYLPRDEHMPAGFTAFPTLTPSPTSGLGPAAPSTYSAFPQQHFEAQGHATTSMNGYGSAPTPAYNEQHRTFMTPQPTPSNAPFAYQPADTPFVQDHATPGAQQQRASLYIKNLPPDADKLYLYERFARFGAILSVKIMTEDATGKCKGVGFVNYATYDAACVAVASMHGTAADGGILHDKQDEPTPQDTPRLTGQYPFASLLISCSGNLNIEGNPLDACFSFGTVCGHDAASAFCRYLGWDGVAEGSLVVKPASGPTRALSGEWCMSPGNYITASNITEAAQIKKADRLPCSRLDSVTCFRRRETFASWLLNNVPSATGQSLPIKGVSGSPIPVTTIIARPVALGRRLLQG
ncbi:hypothetical protein WJX75_002897 [Coccomyxa subellipsoidea]|uniref:RRM domain-containing protein n=1 Tax=Coccomyxa subellipsoidea TaxID=248742 RepID=A0ABR2YM34_9CHLO